MSYFQDIDKADELMADISEQHNMAQQISDAVSQPLGFGDDTEVPTASAHRTLEKVWDWPEGMSWRGSWHRLGKKLQRCYVWNWTCPVLSGLSSYI